MTTIQADAGVWPYGNAAVAINPAKRRKVMMAAAIAAMMVVAYYAVAIDDRGPVSTWVKRVTERERAKKIEPFMRKLADEGKAEPSIWLAKNFPATDEWRLHVLARSGSGEAAFMLATLIWPVDKAAGEKLLQQASEAGYAPAVEYIQREAIRQSDQADRSAGFNALCRQLFPAAFCD